MSGASRGRRGGDGVKRVGRVLPIFDEHGDDVFDQATPYRLVLDLEAVTYIDVTASRQP
jgi:hypothetical protein